jgi:hypothetical protein
VRGIGVCVTVLAGGDKYKGPLCPQPCKRNKQEDRMKSAVFMGCTIIQKFKLSSIYYPGPYLKNS